jgi:hypothetical protein
MVETAACPRAYVEIHINGKEQPDSIPSERGSDIHRVMSRYIDHCVKKQVSSDWVAFNKLAHAAGPVAGPILDGIRDSYEVDWQHVYGTEIPLGLDESFHPCSDKGFIYPGVTANPAPSAYNGTLDGILLSEDGLRAKIIDFKSHPAPFDADTFQSILYPFMLFKHLPNLQVVTFELNFVRYQNCLRSVAWKREEMPTMQTAISRARERQRITHENPDDAMALPCTVCTYCPLGKTMTCPIAEFNEYLTMNLEDRLRWKVWMARMNEVNNPILKAYAAVNGSVTYQDGNGRTFEYGELPVPATTYPLDWTTIEQLEEHKRLSGEDWEKWGLNISSTTIKPKLKAKKRAALREIFEESIIQTSTKPKYAVRTPEGIDQDFNPYEEE